MSHVTVDAWSWTYSSRASAVSVPVSFTVESGERVLLLGASGSGKSTLLSALAGVLGDDEGSATGSITVAGTDPSTHRGQIGLVLQDPESQVIMERVGDDVAFGLENLGVPREHIWPRVREALRVVGLATHNSDTESGISLDTSTSELSGGQQQRLALAGVLAMQPKLLLLDEPTANIDPASIPALKQAVEAVVSATNATVIMVEHRVQYWWDFATRIIVLGAEGLLFNGAPESLTQRALTQLREAGVWLPKHLTVRAKNHATATSNRLKSDPLLTATDLQSAYPPRPSNSRRQLSKKSNPLNLELIPGHIHVLAGPNGSGKTVSALTLAGLLPTQAGSVQAQAELAAGLASNPLRWKSTQLLRRIGFVFQSAEHQFVARTVHEELAVGLGVLKVSEADTATRVREMLEAMQLTDVAQAHPFSLSGGQKRRLSVATSLIVEPRVLILDEPTFGQDANTWATMVGLLRDYASKGNAVLAISHDELFIETVADTVTVLS